MSDQEKDRKSLISNHRQLSRLSSSSKHADIDWILKKIGEYGRSQKILTVFFCLLMIPPTYQTLIMAFVGSTPPWRCSTKGNTTGECIKKGTFSSGEEFYTERCTMNRTSWEFTKPTKFSIVTEYDLVCDKKEISVFANSALYLGWAIGAIVLGWLSDRYGRKIVLYPSYVIVLCVGLISAFSPNFWLFILLRIVVGFFLGGVILTLFILSAELVGPKSRALAATLVWFAFTVSLCLLGLQAYFIPDWRLLQIITTAPYIFFIVFWKFTPESVRWLNVKNRVEDAETILQNVAKKNGKVYPDVSLEPIPENTSAGSFLDLFSTRRLTFITLVQCFVWLVNGMVYYGISLASDDLGGDMYRDFVLTSLVEFPASFLVIISSNKYGRKKTMMYSMFVASFSLIAVGIIPGRTQNEAYNWLRVVTGMLGKLFITIAFDALFVLSAEVYPTTVRSQAMALLSVVSRIGAASSPWVAQGLRRFHFTVPFYFMGGLSFIAACVSFTLPETKGKPTAETFASIKSDELNLQMEDDKDEKNSM